MASYHKAVWEPSFEGRSRRQRLGGPYEWYEPDFLRQMRVKVDLDVVSDIGVAEGKLSTFRESTGAGLLGEGIARLLLRSDALASSNIEGLTIGTRRLLRAELFELQPDNLRFDRRAAEVLGSVRSMDEAIHIVAGIPEITVETLQGMHRKLCEKTTLDPYGGMIRDTQNWVGGSSWSPINATYVPPAPELVMDYLGDLCAFCNRKDVHPIVQAALAHSQFESIHPFADGNGRTGRALIHAMLLRGGLCIGSTPPVSLILATHRKDYFDSLEKMQSYTSKESFDQAVNDWVSTFAGAISDACEQAERLNERLDETRSGWRDTLSEGVGVTATMLEVMDALLSYPIFTVDTMASLIGRGYGATNNAIARLCDVGIIQETNKGKRNRVFEAPEIIEIFDIVQRALASPSYDTSNDQPARPVPYR